MEKDLKLHIHSGLSSRGFLDPKRTLMESGLMEGDRFLDAGCGDGFFSITASHIVGERGKVYAVDIHRESLLILKGIIYEKAIHNVEAIMADLSRGIPLRKESIDVCLMANVFHGFRANGEVKDVLTEAARVMREGGILAVVDFRRDVSSPGPPIEIRLSPKEVECSVVPYGFKVEKTSNLGPYHYSIKFLRSKRLEMLKTPLDIDTVKRS